MVIDTSAILAILQNEIERNLFIKAIVSDDIRLISAGTFLGVSMVVLKRFGTEGLRNLDHFISKAEIGIETVNADQVQFARHAFDEYGKSRHPARLNFEVKTQDSLEITL